WVFLNAIVAVLEPFEEATQILSMDTATLGQVLPLLKFIENMLPSMKETSAEGTVSFNLSAALLSELQASRHLNMIRDDVDYWTASFLDPQFKETLENYIIDPEGKRRVYDHLIAQVVANTRPSFPRPSMTQPPNSDSQRVPASSPLSSRNAGLWSKHSETMGLTTKKEQRAGSHTSRDDTAVVKLELNGYVQDDSDHNACSDPLLYWSNTKDRLPCLFAVASHYLACPPTKQRIRNDIVASSNFSEVTGLESTTLTFPQSERGRPDGGAHRRERAKDFLRPRTQGPNESITSFVENVLRLTVGPARQPLEMQMPKTTAGNILDERRRAPTLAATSIGTTIPQRCPTAS
ncbi:hypothetical protein HPB47_003306, partial [Ixodes persulcatus]